MNAAQTDSASPRRRLFHTDIKYQVKIVLRLFKSMLKLLSNAERSEVKEKRSGGSMQVGREGFSRSPD